MSSLRRSALYIPRVPWDEVAEVMEFADPPSNTSIPSCSVPVATIETLTGV